MDDSITSNTNPDAPNTGSYPTTSTSTSIATSSSSSSSSSSSESIPLWAIIVVVIAGTAVVVTALVYGCSYLHRWRWARRHRRTIFIDGREVSVYHASSVASSSNRSSSIVGGGGDQSSLFFDDVDFWRGGGGGGVGWGGSTIGGGADGGFNFEDVDSYYTDGGCGTDSGRSIGKLRKKRQRGSKRDRGRRSSSGAGFGRETSSIMSELSVGDIAMVEAGIRRETSSSTKEAGGNSSNHRRRNRHNILNLNRDNSNSDINSDSGRRGFGHLRLKSLSLPPTLPEVWRMSSGLLSVVSFQSLFNSLTSMNTSNGPPDPSKEASLPRTSGGPHARPGHRRQTSNAWIDEDTIHGPAVSDPKGKRKAKGKASSILASPVGSRRKGVSWRRSFRESWPLRTMISPTLPKLSSPWGSPKVFGSPLFGSPKARHDSGGDGMLRHSSTVRSSSGTLNSYYHQQGGGGGYHHDAISSFRFPNEPPHLAPPHHGSNHCLDYSPPRQLPKPPRQALLAASVESAGGSPLGHGFYRGSNWTTGTRSMTMANMTPSRSTSGRSVSGSSSDRGLLSYYKYEDTDMPVVLSNLYQYPVGMNSGGVSGNVGSGGPVASGATNSNGGPGVAITTPRENMVPAPLRLSSADSTLSGILRDTEKRLQDGTVTGVTARRAQRISTSPSKRALVRTGSGGPLRPRSASITSGSTGGGNEHIATLMITSAGAVHHAPSPGHPSPASSPSRLPPHRASGHIRRDSQASIGSEADSLFAAPSPLLDHFHPLTSPVKNGGMGVGPSGPPPQHPVPPLPLTRHNSFTGSVSSSGSSLPTIYSVDENADGDGDDTRITAFGSSTSEGLNRLAGFVTDKSSSNTLDDPFVVNWPAAAATALMRSTPSPTRPSTSGRDRRLVGAQTSSGRRVPEFSQGPRLYGGPARTSEATLRSQSPLEAISGNSSRAMDTRMRRSESNPRSGSRIPRAQSIPRSQTPRVQTPHSQQGLVLLAAPTSAFSTMDSERRHEKRDKSLELTFEDSDPNLLIHSSTIPNIFLTTPSEKSDSPQTGPKRTEELRSQASSPTLGRSREQTPESAPPSPALSKQLSNVYDYYIDMPSNDVHALSSYRRAAGEVHKLSETSSTAYLADSRDYEHDKNRVMEELNDLIENDNVNASSARRVSTPAIGTTTDNNGSSVRMVAPEWLSNHILFNKPMDQNYDHPNQRQPPNPTRSQVQARDQELLQPQYQPRGQYHHKQQGQGQGQGQSQIPVSSTVAQLRRMNSLISSYSNAASGYSDGSSSAGPFLPAVMEGSSPIVSPPRNRRDSTRNYLALGSPPKRASGESRRGAGAGEGEGEGGGGGSSGPNDKENKHTHHEAASSSFSSSSSSRPGAGPHASRIPRLETTTEWQAPETPRRQRSTRHQRAASGPNSDTNIGGSMGRGSASNHKGNNGGNGTGTRARTGTRASEDSLELYDIDGFWVSPGRVSTSSRPSTSGFRM